MSDFNKQILDTIKSDEKLNSFIKELTDEQLEDYLLVLYKQAKDNKICANCLGKKACERDEENYQAYLTLENDKVIRNLTPCEYIPTFNFELVDMMFLPKNAFEGEVLKQSKEELASSNRQGFIKAAQAINDKKSRKGIYSYGQYGTGKSFLTYKLVSNYAKNGKTVAFCNVPALMLSIKENISEHGYMDKIIVKLKNVDVLVLDDLGTERNTPFTRDEVLYPVLDYRMNDSTKITFVTSNCNYNQLEEHFALDSITKNIDVISGGRIMERIRAITTPVELKGTNFRLQK